MARPREFDQEAALSKAMDLFWQKGYERTSIQDLVEHTGVHRGSLYDTFGDKNQLFLSCLDRFRETSKDRTMGLLEEAGDPKEALQRYFSRLIDIAMNEETGRRGCLIANTAMELGAMDPTVSRRIEAYTLDMEVRFTNFLMRAQQQGSLKSKHSVRELARFLLSTRNGLYVLAKSVTDRKVLEDAVNVALSVFK
ncbi:TetR/AcrR family transcriptional regulator [Paenibacillus cremeus]|uniref:TetR family transcriptional regulator n=1 Tax=Paenibacillus cremeus TaxID=2163881 RepID=A0A559KGJ3_9BACL|nr:TetR/AcrR family transcriptional regulator [Paenibacillus cremeus]TVY11249.1 TetR family transcriptional regulator [Paenibacillus cremeus]